MKDEITANDDGVKLKPEIMEKEKLYYCIFKDKIILAFKDHQDFLNCFEIEESEIVDKIKSSGEEDIEIILENYIEKENLKKWHLPNNFRVMSKKSNTDAEDILSELENQVDNQSITEDTKVEDTKVEDAGKEKYEINHKPQERNTIPIGKKPIMTYVNSTLTQLSSLPSVTITARGRSITAAVDVSQFILKRMNSVGYKISDVRISSSLLESNDGKKRNVSSIEIDIMRI